MLHFNKLKKVCQNAMKQLKSHIHSLLGITTRAWDKQTKAHNQYISVIILKCMCSLLNLATHQTHNTYSGTSENTNDSFSNGVCHDITPKQKCLTVIQALFCVRSKTAYLNTCICSVYLFIKRFKCLRVPVVIKNHNKLMFM